MKHILILRHAKSDWSNPALADFDRPLAERGLKDAPLMGQALARFRQTPDIIISSPARRAKQTAELAARAANFQGTIRWNDSLYPGSSSDLLAALRALPDTIERPMLVGHNPAFANTAALLCNLHPTDKPEDIRLPTAGLICFAVNIANWSALESGDGVLRWFLIPKLLKALR